MTPLQFITAECANHQPDGSCLGMVINDDLSITRGRALPRCLIAEGKRCQYFEECVAPMADWTSDPRLAASRQAAVAEYREITNQKTPQSRPCPDCGGPLLRGRRRCPNCQIRHRKAVKAPARPLYASPAAGFQNPIPDSHPPQNTPLTVEARPPREAA